MYIITTFFIAQLMFMNAGFIIYHTINWYSYFQMKLTTNKKKIGNEEKDTLDCLIGNYLITENDTSDALDEINGSDFAVLICKGTDMVCFYPPVEEYNPEYELSDIQFISVKVEIDSVEHDVRLKTPEYTFYIVGNELNANWIRYYFCKYLNISLPNDVKYVMTIIDDNVQFVIINENQSLVINKDSYDIFDYIEEDNAVQDSEVQDNEIQDNAVQDNEIQDNSQEEDNAVQDKDIDDVQQEDPTELSLDRMIELEDEIKEELQHEEEQEPVDDLDIDKIIAEFDMSNITIFSHAQVAVNNEDETIDSSNNLVDNEKGQGWFKLF